MRKMLMVVLVCLLMFGIASVGYAETKEQTTEESKTVTVENNSIMTMLEAKGVDALVEMESWLKATKDLIIEQAPLFIQEYLRWHFFKNVFVAVICCLITIVLILFIIRGLKYLTHCRIADEGPVIAFSIIGTIIAMVSGIAAIGHAYNALYIYVAPRIYIAENLIELWKK